MSSTPLAAHWAATRAAPLWVTIALHAAANADPDTGELQLQRGELRALVDPWASRQALHRAIARAVEAGWLHPTSTSRRLRLARPHK